MRVALFIPCFVDQLYPRAGLATAELLERLGIGIDYPEAQTCCGQPLCNAGLREQTRPVVEHFARVFGDYDTIVCPSGSCVAMVRQHLDGLLPDGPALQRLRQRTFELCEFLVDVLGVSEVQAEFPHRVAVHTGCHAQRELRLAAGSERPGLPLRSALHQLLSSVRGLRFAEPARPDECCGFGGSFAVGEPAVSGRMGRDRVEALSRSGAEVVVGSDVSCLLHLSGIARRQGRQLPMLHVAEVLVARGPLPPSQTAARIPGLASA